MNAAILMMNSNLCIITGIDIYIYIYIICAFINLKTEYNQNCKHKHRLYFCRWCLCIVVEIYMMCMLHLIRAKLNPPIP